ncbi:low specificity L-threonine aldolase [Roseovarius sp. TE539]|uniref:threonine aldolase family protein n=1 Tax=Roseovarius sp. TE539 TaxID=2249812 RepID=UPI000DDCDB8C|nr:beta-eliminating lyase-related protein [Roseovarius sp. TE539]RBI72678.1 low specificity L-threonine aldolase [Roseovarius sp. TE539]
MFFASDNTGPAHPQVLAGLGQANEGYAAPYGTDELNLTVRERLRSLFEAPEAAVYLVATGTAANALALATLSRPWDTIFCTRQAHIEADECNAPEFYTGGAKLTLVGDADKLDPDTLRAAIGSKEFLGVHGPQRGPVALTQVTEMGQVYSCAEIAALGAVAHDYDVPLYMDGARFANAVAALGCTPAEMTWKAGVDAVSFGATKNGCLGVEAVIFFDPAHAWEFELRRKRGAHLFSKHRFLSAQMDAYLEDGLWLRSAQAANASAARLAEGLRGVPGCTFLAEPQANMIFARLPRAAHQRLQAAGAVYGLYEGPLGEGAPDEPLLMRLVCDWSCPPDAIDRFIATASG